MAEPPLFSTFKGVFTPTLLTIFGVIMYVRVGWAVGNAGLLGAWLVLLLAIGITAATGLSLSSIATNTRIGPGGPYAIMVRSLGYEVGGSIGIPLYLTRPLGVAMYIIGFREGWLWLFPDHPALAIDLIVFFLLSGISYLSADLAFRVQYLIMAVVIASILAMFLSPATFESTHEIVWWGDYPGFPETGFQGIDFWVVFAVLFPATTGILAGANMSGDLKDPRRAIPVGTLWAIGISSVVYLGLAWWNAHVASPEELLNDYNVAINKSLWPPLVMAGLLGATASSGLAGLVGGPRILMAMGQNRIVPWSDKMARTDARGNPRAAIVVTSLLTLLCIMVRDLNVIAPLVTMFFLITYSMLNVVVLFESSLGLVSFRPTLRIPRLVPLVGLVGCIFSMFIVNAIFGLLSVGLVIMFYVWIQRRGRHAASDDVRSSVFVSLAQWAASRVTEDQYSNVRAWKPNLLVAVDDPEDVRGQFDLLLDLAQPEGSLTLLGITPGEGADELLTRLRGLAEDFRARKVQSAGTVVRTADPLEGVGIGAEALQGAFFRPNTLLVTLDVNNFGHGRWDALLERLATIKIGAVVVAPHPKAGMGQRRSINVWVPPPPPGSPAEAAFEADDSLDLSLLMGYRLMRKWGGELSLTTVVSDASAVATAEHFLGQLCDLARYPTRVRRRVMIGELQDALGRCEISDVNILGLPSHTGFERLMETVHTARSTCLFVYNSGRESALA